HALLREGFGRAAVAYARRATELAPDDPWAWSTYGYALLCDDVGRPIVDGVDPEPGRAALRRAVELSPWAVLAAQNLGVSLVHDEHATPFGPGARVDEAIAVLDERRRATGYVDLDGDLLRD